MALTSAGATAVMNALISGNKYVGLGLAANNPGTTGSGFTEPSAPEYRRVLLTGKMSGVVFPHNGQKEGYADNTDTLYYPEATTTGGWGSVLYFGIFSSAAGNDLIVYGELNNGVAVTIAANTVPLFRANQLSITVS